MGGGADPGKARLGKSFIFGGEFSQNFRPGKCEFYTYKGFLWKKVAIIQQTLGLRKF
jgi:hypothetical protein